MLVKNIYDPINYKFKICKPNYRIEAEAVVKVVAVGSLEVQRVLVVVVVVVVVTLPMMQMLLVVVVMLPMVQKVMVAVMALPMVFFRYHHQPHDYRTM
jgi:hypothetical protein